MEKKQAPVLSVIEELSDQKVETYQDRLFDESFWIPLIPFHLNLFKKIGTQQFQFEIEDTFKLDTSGFISKKFYALGTISAIDHGEEDSKGYLWELIITLTEPKVSCNARIRAKNIPEKNALKLGIFVQQLDFDNALLEGLGRDAILFAIRVNIRKMLQLAAQLN